MSTCRGSQLLAVSQIQPWSEISQFQRHIASFPDIDSPEVFGLHSNADLTYRMHTVGLLLSTMAETQPRLAMHTSGMTVEDVVTTIRP